MHMNIKELVPEKVESEINSPDHPTRRFVGFALLLAWHYNLWFLHDSFVGAQLLDDCVTQSWLIALVSAAVSFIVIAFALGRKHRLCNIPWMLWIATAAAVISTLALTLFAFSFPTDLIAYALAAVVGITNAILWVMWGELYSRTKTSFSVSYIGTTVGLVTLVCSLICFVLPTGISSVLIGFAFGFSGAFIRLGIAVGNAIALYYEANPAFAKVATEPTSLLFVCVLAAVIIPLVRQEYNITQLMAPPATESSQEHRIKELAAEFSLSARETEIVMLIARGFTTDNVAKKLVISPYTANTHIRHVYEKVGIHKRSELIDYINRTGSEDDKA